MATWSTWALRAVPLEITDKIVAAQRTGSGTSWWLEGLELFDAGLIQKTVVIFAFNGGNHLMCVRCCCGPLKNPLISHLKRGIKQGSFQKSWPVKQQVKAGKLKRFRWFVAIWQFRAMLFIVPSNQPIHQWLRKNLCTVWTRHSNKRTTCLTYPSVVNSKIPTMCDGYRSLQQRVLIPLQVFLVYRSDILGRTVAPWHLRSTFWTFYVYNVYIPEVTPRKIKIEPESDGLEDDFPFPVVYSQVPC